MTEQRTEYAPWPMRSAGGRWELPSAEQVHRRRQAPPNVRLVGAGAIPPALRDAIWSGADCAGQEQCVLVHEPGAIRQGRIEIRQVPRRQLFLDGEPIGEAFE